MDVFFFAPEETLDLPVVAREKAVEPVADRHVWSPVRSGLSLVELKSACPPELLGASGGFPNLSMAPPQFGPHVSPRLLSSPYVWSSEWTCWSVIGRSR